MSEASSSKLPEPLYQVKLLAALRNGDVALITQLLTEIGKNKRKSSDSTSSDDPDLGAAALHLSIRCASVETVALLLSHRSISPNTVYPRGSGTTPLHLAASIGRADVVNLLLEQEGIDDTLRDAHGRTCKDVARGKEVQKVLHDSKTLLTASFRSLLHHYIASPLNQGPPQALLDLLNSPRIRLVDLSYLDPTTGRSLLHEAARRKDLTLINLSIKAGADVFVRDRRGKAVGENGTGAKDDKVRVFLRQFTNQDTSLLGPPGSDSDPPALKGYLSKYTNVAKGYNTRWFVLKNGVLSYYRHQDDEHVASRGSIAMKSAELVGNTSGDKLRFEIRSTPGRGQQRWYIKGSHTIEVGRWIQAISRSIELARRDGSQNDSSGGENQSLRSYNASVFRPSFSSRTVGKDTSSSIHDTLDASGGSEEDEARDNLGSLNKDDVHATAPGSSSESLTERRPPHDTNFELHGNSTSAQAELSSQLTNSFNLPNSTSKELQEVYSAIVESVATTARMVNELVRMSAEREEWWRERLLQERQRGALWEESLQVVVKEGEALEQELKNRARTVNKRSSRIPLEAPKRSSSDLGRSTIRMHGDLQSGMMSPPLFKLDQPTPKPDEYFVEGKAEPGSLTHKEGDLREPRPSVTIQDTESLVDTDEEDEFFDAIDSNALPNVVVPNALVKSPEIDIETSTAQYEAYRFLRDRLPIEKDTRPPTSLWSVLKHSIGKDLTKISFPVFFNEPTSMLQRMAEDMEFSECLDAASTEPDPHKRIAFVAAFGMSNYSSTIGRIAKPFNPMLSETFEYVRLDKKYRYVSEQVSHHPPVSACWAESPFWHYFGEVDAQNKFMGKSFEIRPTGVAHAELIIPEEYASPKFKASYPKATEKAKILGEAGKGKVIEHYSWKKVTTNVSGFILGSPTIDHYGDMIVVNHRTGDTCVLTFKPRGWRGKDAYEIFGRVMDADGNVTYEIAGRWNSQLVARAIGTGTGVLHPDVSVHSSSRPGSTELERSQSTFEREFVLLWRNTQKPAAPFNLTPFAITLNALPEDKLLARALCPTDCRFRPDQRAFELGKYERANELKQKQEEKQRATRKAREEGTIPPHKPKWFEARIEADTGERVWEPYRSEEGEVAYWTEREKVWKGEHSWIDVENIFIEDEP